MSVLLPNTLYQHCTDAKKSAKKGKGLVLEPLQIPALQAFTGCLKFLTTNNRCSFRVAQLGALPLLLQLKGVSNLLIRRNSSTTIGAPHHSCWRASFLAFCLGGRPAIYTIYIPYTSFIYSMYIYNYIHTWLAACNVKNQFHSNRYAPPPSTLGVLSIEVFFKDKQDMFSVLSFCSCLICMMKMVNFRGDLKMYPKRNHN